MLILHFFSKGIIEFEKMLCTSWEGSGSVVKCLTRDRGVAGSSLTEAMCSFLGQDTLSSA